MKLAQVPFDEDDTEEELEGSKEEEAFSVLNRVLSNETFQLYLWGLSPGNKEYDTSPTLDTGI